MIEIKILGTGCPNCLKLEQLVNEVCKTINFEANIIKVENIEEIINHGVMITPGLIINGKVRSQGKIPTRTTLEHWIINKSAK